jgi:hypothetical protein
MSEKRGNTGKLIYSFNTAANLEIQIEDKWYRVTAREFRSFNGERRVNQSSYVGPIYLFGTNTKVENPNKKGIIFVNDVDPRLFNNKRTSERNLEFEEE